MPDNTTAARAVFLSYAHEDAEPVRRIADALRAFGVEVWFDQNELRGGDAWDAKIRTQIRTCTLCVPVISANTQARGEGYFRREWKIAVERTHDMASGVPFLLPVVIDDTPQNEALVPDEFARVQWTRLAKGVPTPQFVEQVKRLLEGKVAPVSDRRMGTAAPTDAGQRPALPKSGLPGWTWGALAAVVIGIAVALSVARKPEPAATPDPKSQTPDQKPATFTVPVQKLADKSIAVIPFTNMSEDKDASAFFADGIHEDILTNLALIRELRVVSRTSVMPYRTTSKPMRQIAEELGVTYILEGSVRRSGNKVRVTGQLIHAATDEHVWAHAYDRDLTDIFTIQSELSSQIASALKAALSPEEKVLLARRPTENPVAYDLFLRARDAYNREGNTVASRLKRIELLQSAVDLDPAFAQAWGDLSGASAFAYFGNLEGGEAHLARAKAAIERAVQLAPDDPSVIQALGTYHYYGYRDYARATEQYERLARLQPNSPIVFNSLALIQRRQGRWAQSLVNSRRASELDPANLTYLRILLNTLQAGRRGDEVIAVQRRISALLPESLLEAYLLAIQPYSVNGSRREAETFFARLKPEQLNSPLGIELRARWAGLTGDLPESIRLDKLQPYYDEDGTPHAMQALGAAIDYYLSGDKPGALARLGDFPAELRQLSIAEPANTQAWLNLAQAEVIMGHPEEAVRCAERAVELMPDTRDALDGPRFAVQRAFIYEFTGDIERAMAEFIRLVRIPNGISAQRLKNMSKTLPAILVNDPRFQALINDPKNYQPLF